MFARKLEAISLRCSLYTYSLLPLGYTFPVFGCHESASALTCFTPFSRECAVQISQPFPSFIPSDLRRRSSTHQILDVMPPAASSSKAVLRSISDDIRQQKFDDALEKAQAFLQKEPKNYQG